MSRPGQWGVRKVQTDLLSLLQDEKPDHLSALLQAYNNTVHSSTSLIRLFVAGGAGNRSSPTGEETRPGGLPPSNLDVGL